MSESQPLKKRMDPLSLVAILIVLVIIGVNVWNAKQAKAPLPEEMPIITPTNETPDDPGKTVTSDFILPTAFERVIEAEQTINTTQGKTGATGNLEQIVYGIVTDPNTPDTVYFATSSNNPKENFVGIYRYNTRTRHWQRLYKHTFVATETEPVKRLHVVGIEGEDLIITEGRLGDLPDPCTSPLLASRERSTLSLKYANDGLKPFTLSEEAKMAEEAKQTECKAK